MQSTLDIWAGEFSSLAWGLPLLVTLIGGGIWLILQSRGMTYRYLNHAIDLVRGKYTEDEAEGELSHFQALSTALASTIGMGNIAGVAVAISIGGPGAIFWMWVSGIIGMSTKFFTCALSIMYRGRDTEGKVQGGPMYFIEEGLGTKWKPMAMFFAVMGLLGALPLVNVNQLTQAIRDIVLKPHGAYTEGASEWIIGIVLLIVTAIVILGGLKRIAQTASRLVPSMVVIYFIAVLIILITHVGELPHYFMLIFRDAFGADSYHGDDFLGGALGGLILVGIKRGAFSNEAGIGMAPMAHGASKTSEPVREGLVAMLGPFIDTVVVCTLTALAILVTDVWQTTSSDGVTLTAQAFGSAIPGWGQYLLMLCIAIFSISSLFSFAYYGTKCTSYLFGAKRAHYYNFLYLASILLAATNPFSAVLNFVDGCYGMMAFPTMIATLILAPKVHKRAKDYFASYKVGH